MLLLPSFFLVLGVLTSFFEEVLVGGVPVGYAVAKDDAWAVKGSWGFLFAFKMSV
jgi:hypothetical protein